MISKCQAIGVQFGFSAQVFSFPIAYTETNAETGVSIMQIYKNGVEQGQHLTTDDVSALPSGFGIIVGLVYRLTTTDNVVKVPPGFYYHDGTGWICNGCAGVYAYGNLGATPSMSLISGAAYSWVVNQIVTSWSLTMSRPGEPAIYFCANAGGLAVAVPTMSGRGNETIGWDKITEEKTTGSIVDNGVDLFLTCGKVD